MFFMDSSFGRRCAERVCFRPAVAVLGAEPIVAVSPPADSTGRVGWKRAGRSRFVFSRKRAELSEVPVLDERPAVLESGARVALEAAAELAVEVAALGRERLRAHGTDQAADSSCLCCD
jgi:hypothetical protein